MPDLLWDASALVKRYITEGGTDVVHALFRGSPAVAFIGSLLGYGEAASVLRRRLNAGTLSAQDYRAARAFLESEVLTGPRFRLLSVDDADILAGIGLSDRYNLNASDAAILAGFLRDRSLAAAGAATPVLIAADHRLLRAALAEGLAVFDPETASQAEATALLSQP